jgi:CO/xanthine dehydrogenase Mo-binding subunit
VTEPLAPGAGRGGVAPAIGPGVAAAVVPGEGPADGPKPGDRLDRWIRIEPDGSAVVQTGKVEIGQGLHLAFAQLVADELELPMDRVRVAPVDTGASPDEGVTAGSRSMEESGLGHKRVAAEARASHGHGGAARRGLAPGDVSLDDGVVRGVDGRSVGYGELAAAGALARPFSGTIAPKPPAERRLVGASVPRRDLPGKVTGAPVFVQDLELPGMVHGRVVRPPGPGARLVSVDEEAIRALPGVLAMVRDGTFLGVVAEREEQAIAALARARRAATWEAGPAIPAIADPRYLADAESDETVGLQRDDPAARARAVTHLRAEYTRPFLAHAAIAPSCAIARFDGGEWSVWAHSQGIFRLRFELAKVLGTTPDRILVTHAQGPGVYGHNGADDVALDAALMARAVPGRPVRVQWMRDDEFAWEPVGTAMLVRLSAGVDADGRIVDWRHDAWGHGSGSRPSMAPRPGVSSLLAARHLPEPFQGAPPLRSGDLRNAVPPYIFANERVVGHHVAVAPLRTSSLRSLGAHANVFAIESFMDEIALAIGVDAIELRLRHLEDPRATAVIRAAADLAGWTPGETGDGERGRGLGFARYKDTSAYAAVVVEVEVGSDVRVRRAWGAIDAGMVVSHDGLLNQAEGGIVQAVSWALHESVRVEGSQVATRGWDTYRILSFTEAPEVEVVAIDRPEEPPLGAGEAFAGPTAGAIGNAIARAIGLRVRDLPFTGERLAAAAGTETGPAA